MTLSAEQSIDITAITQLVVRERESRDMGYWKRMRDCFHAEARINISWINGNADEFVVGSIDMAARGMKAKHRLGPVLVSLNTTRAVATLSGIIDIPTVLEGKEFTLSAHCLMVYRVEKRDAQWRLMSFEVIYRRDELIPAIPGDTVDLPRELLASFRQSYRYLSYSLHLTGYQVNHSLAGEDQPETGQALLEGAFSWAGLAVPD